MEAMPPEEIPKPGEPITEEQMDRLARDPAMQKRRQAIGDPTRMRILGLVSESNGLTAKELAERLRTDPNRLYYHLRILEEAGVLGVSELRPAGRVTERVYKEIYEGRYIWDPQDPLSLVAHMSSQLEIAKIEAEEALFEQSRKLEKSEEPPAVIWARASVRATRAEMNDFYSLVVEQLNAIGNRHESADEKTLDLRTMRFTFVICEEDDWSISNQANDAGSGGMTKAG